MRVIAPAILALLLCGGIYAQTPDEETPANEGVCDDLMYATPGLFGLCIAFCEAQDCVPEISLDNPFENCTPGSEKVLANYRKKMGPSDLDMPCVMPSCPCWTQQELDAMGPWAGLPWDYTCRYDPRRSMFDYPDTNGRTYILHTLDFSDLGMLTYCYYESRGGISGDPIKRFMFISAEDVATCAAQVDQKGAELGLSCWTD